VSKGTTRRNKVSLDNFKMTAPLIGLHSQAPILKWFSFWVCLCVGHAPFRSRLINTWFRSLHALVGQNGEPCFGTRFISQQSFTASSRHSSTRGTFPLRFYKQWQIANHVMASVEPYRKSVLSIHILCRITASLRATAITARR